jgi:hypothetical protein
VIQASQTTFRQPARRAVLTFQNILSESFVDRGVFGTQSLFFGFQMGGGAAQRISTMSRHDGEGYEGEVADDWQHERRSGTELGDLEGELGEHVAGGEEGKSPSKTRPDATGSRPQARSGLRLDVQASMS